MRTEQAVSEAFTIYDAPKLDPITVVLQDSGAGKGKVIVECFGDAWSAYFGATGERRIREFLSDCGVDYLAGKLCPTSHRPSKAQQKYLERIAAAVLEALAPNKE